MTNKTIKFSSTVNYSKRTERRVHRTQSFFYSFFMRRRARIRRKEDGNTSFYIDVYEPIIFVLFSVTVFLSAIDAIFTIFIVSNGGEEINPFMRYLLGKDVYAFFWVKFFLTSFGMLFLVIHKHFLFYQTLRGYHIMYSIFIVYFFLVNYELVLISKIFAIH